MNPHEYCPQCGKRVNEHDNYACDMRPVYYDDVVDMWKPTDSKVSHDLNAVWDRWMKASAYQWEQRCNQAYWNEFVQYAMMWGYSTKELVAFAKERWHPDNRPNLDDLEPPVFTLYQQ